MHSSRVKYVACEFQTSFGRISSMRQSILNVYALLLVLLPSLALGAGGVEVSAASSHSNAVSERLIHIAASQSGKKTDVLAAVNRAPQGKVGGEVSVRDFGAVGDGETDDTAAFNAAIAQTVANGGGGIYVPNPIVSYKITSTLIVGATGKSITFHGDGVFNSVIHLKSTAATVLFKTYGLVKLRDLTLTGTPVAGNVFRVGDVGIEVHGDIKFSGVSMMGFQYGMNWKEFGYYIKISDSDFRLMDTVMVNFDANNLTIERVKAVQINRFLVTATGVGPVVIRDSSFEYWTGTLFSNSAGAAPLYVITGNYFENRPQITIETGLARNPFDLTVNTYIGVVIANAGDTVLDSNMISCHGIYRIVDTGGAARSIKSTRNLIVYQPMTSYTDRFFNIGNVKTLQLNDFAYPIETGSTGSHTPIAYGGFTTIYPESSKVINPITLMDETPEVAWGVMTLENAWVNSDTKSYQVASYKKVGRRVYLRGMVNGAGAATSNIATLPTGYRPTTKVYRVMSTNTMNSTPLLVSLRVDIKGTLSVTNTTYTSMRYLVLDGLSFDLD